RPVERGAPVRHRRPPPRPLAPGRAPPSHRPARRDPPAGDRPRVVHPRSRAALRPLQPARHLGRARTAIRRAARAARPRGGRGPTLPEGYRARRALRPAARGGSHSVMSDNSRSMDRELEEVIRIARRAGEVVRAVYATPFTVEMKGPNDPVTRADREANELICGA